jgi:hypothetical protein
VVIRWCNDVLSKYRLNVSTSGSSGIALTFALSFGDVPPAAR